MTPLFSDGKAFTITKKGSSNRRALAFKFFSQNVSRILTEIQHLEWVKKGNDLIFESLHKNNELNREAFSHLVVGVHNLANDLQDLSDLLLEISDEIDGVSGIE